MVDEPVDAAATKVRRIADLRDKLTVDSSKFEPLCTIWAREMGIPGTFPKTSVRANDVLVATQQNCDSAGGTNRRRLTLGYACPIIQTLV